MSVLGEGANRVVLKIELICSPNEDKSMESFFPNICHVKVIYLLGKGKNQTAVCVLQ